MVACFSTVINDFVKDFGLKISHGSIMFESKILFLENAAPSYYNCKTAIVPVNIKNSCVVYFLNASISRDGFNDHFTLADNSVSYLKNEGLKITANKKFSVYIFPLVQENADPDLIHTAVDKKLTLPESLKTAEKKNNYHDHLLSSKN